MIFAVAIASGAGVIEGVGVAVADDDGMKVAVGTPATETGAVAAGLFVAVGSAASAGATCATSWLWVAGNTV